MKLLCLSIIFLIGADGLRLMENVVKIENEIENEEMRGDLWAVLLAGSNGWYNYRHQADVCHAYQILRSHGVPDSRIIVMMFDDIANNEENPTPGKIINKPNGPDVYEGVPKDYTGATVTPGNFLKILKGDAEGLRGVGSGKVLKSGPNDRVFINMVDHGAPGLFAFPNDVLYATNLTNAMLEMHKDNRFKQLVMYVESCESGSLFKGLLPHDIEIYALSASSPQQHSYACYYDDERSTYLGDVFSIKWMEDTDVENLHKETLRQQFQLVRSEVTTSTVMHWGELKLGGQKLSRFLGNKDHSHIRQSFTPSRTNIDDPCLNSSIANPDVPIGIFKAHLRRATSLSAQRYWKEQIETLTMNRMLVKLIMWKISAEVTGEREKASLMTNAEHQHPITRWDCYIPSVQAFHQECFNLSHNPYATRVLGALVNLCEHGYTSDQILTASKKICIHDPMAPVL